MWYYSQHGQNIGPIEDSVLRQLFNSGQLGPSTPVWREGMEQWTLASQCGLVAPIADPDSVQRAPQAMPAATQGDTTGGLIPYKNPKALTGYYMGVGALIPCFGLGLGPAALMLGIQGLQYAKANPIVKGTVHAWVAIVLGGLSTLVNWGGLLLIFISAASS